MHADLDLDFDPRDLLLLPAAPVTLLLSGVFTGIVVAASHDVVQQDAEEHVVGEHDCSLRAAYIPIEIVLPSGNRLIGATDGTGQRTIEIPANEPPTGTAVVLSGSARAVVIYGTTTHAAHSGHAETVSFSYGL